ncbi:hypothetical protein U9M48_020815 [Paspalum notatum var. saurae]|uniref:Uncharacterized protein n=1 Tax=Paspalum notatum var. saurae TaxID=547442 RepID=A0AAQ3WSU2_PASNO
MDRPWTAHGGYIGPHENSEPTRAWPKVWPRCQKPVVFSPLPFSVRAARNTSAVLIAVVASSPCGGRQQQHYTNQPQEIGRQGHDIMDADELSMKLLIDTKAQKVCFAEAGNNVVEFLSTLLCLPVSTIINLLTKERMVGSIGNILDSVQELDTKYVISSRSKECYVSPAELLDAPQNVSESFFTCPNQGKVSHYGSTITYAACGYFSTIKDTICPCCHKSMGNALVHVKADGLVAGTATYTVKDDLSVTPASSVSSITLLAQCGVKDLSTLQERTVKIGKEEALEILLASLKSKTVLTDVFLEKKKARCKKETGA